MEMAAPKAMPPRPSRCLRVRSALRAIVMICTSSLPRHFSFGFALSPPLLLLRPLNFSASGSRIDADAVLVTVPLAVLQRLPKTALTDASIRRRSAALTSASANTNRSASSGGGGGSLGGIRRSLETDDTASESENDRVGAILFDPPLSAARRTAIARLRMGTVNRVALQFAHAFWPPESHWIGYDTGAERATRGRFRCVLGSCV